MDLQKVFDNWEFQLHRVSTLVLLLIASNITLAGVILPLLSSYYSNRWIDLIVVCLVSLAISLLWYYHRTTFPKGNTRKQNLIIAITTEDQKQKARIAKDFANEIRRQLAQNGLNLDYDVIVLHNHLADSIQNKIHLWVESVQSGIRDSEDVVNFWKVVNRLNARFFVYGNLIQRNGQNSTYCLNIEALLLHAQADSVKSEELKQEFSRLWRREITFLQEDELNGFKSNANHIFFTATYMLGLATFIDNRFQKGIEIWEKLQEYVKTREDLVEFENRLLKLKGASYLMQSRLLLFQGQIEESVQLRHTYLSLFPHEYDSHLTESIRQINRGNTDLALQHVEQAEKFAAGDGTWRYNKLYLLIHGGRCVEAIEVLEDILVENYHSEFDTVGQVINYNQNCLRSDSGHIQTYFIVGVLLFKKLNNPASAYENLEQFLEVINDDVGYEPLRKKAQDLISELNRTLQIEDA